MVTQLTQLLFGVFISPQNATQIFLSPLEVNAPYLVNCFFIVNGLEREGENEFVAIAMGVLDEHSFLFAGSGEGHVYQVRMYIQYICFCLFCAISQYHYFKIHSF